MKIHQLILLAFGDFFASFQQMELEFLKIFELEGAKSDSRCKLLPESLKYTLEVQSSKRRELKSKTYKHHYNTALLKYLTHISYP